MVCANQNRICVCEAGNGNSLLCASHATKNVLVDGSPEPCCLMGQMKHESKQNLFKHTQIKKCVSM